MGGAYTAIAHDASANYYNPAGIVARKDLSIEVCSQCHPFYTGKQKIVDAGGRVDKFRRRYGRS